MHAVFLTETQIWGDEFGNGQLQVMKQYGTKTGMSDLAIVLGGLMGIHKTSDNQRSGCVWTSSDSSGNYIRYINTGGTPGDAGPSGRLPGARPALPSSVTSSINPREVWFTRVIGGVQVVEFGEYPQSIAPQTVSSELEQLFSSAALQTTGKTYTFDKNKFHAYSQPFRAKEYAEYRHGDKRYIRVEAQPHSDNSVLSTGQKPQEGEACWIEVQPIEWLVDTTGLWVARQALFSGVRFDDGGRYNGNFGNTEIKKYLDDYFIKEMQPAPVVAQMAEATEAKTASDEITREEPDYTALLQELDRTEKLRQRFKRPDHLGRSL